MACKCDSFQFIKEAKTQIVIYNLVTTTTDYGGVSVDWQEIATLWAAVKPKSNNELNENGRRITKTSYDIIIRYDDDFANALNVTKYKISFDDKTLSIDGSKSFHNNLKDYGKDYIILSAVDNDAELTS